jgi:glycosyltransferase involved in cell wall biosynthesis
MRILYLEPFDGGSHAMFTRVVTSSIDAQWTRVTLPGRYWKWHMRVAAVDAVLQHAEALSADHDVVFASSYLPLAELVGLCPRLSAIPRALYFHENQLAYPARDHHQPMPERDLHYGFTQLVSALAADVCLFNSAYNRDSFLAGGAELLARMPDAVPEDWIDRIRDRSEVLSFPVDLPDTPPVVHPVERDQGPVLLWNHRWEHDKDPTAFFAALRELDARGLPFRVIVCGESYARRPAVFDEARMTLGGRVLHWGFAPSRAAYLELLARADLVVSTARHEFFGISMLEATHLGAYPLVPDRLAYVELFPPAHRYADMADLVARLVALCERYVGGGPLRADRREITRPHLASRVVARLAARLEALTRA